MQSTDPHSEPNPIEKAHHRRPRYTGKNPRRFEEKYKEQDPEKYAGTVAKVIASGKTPAGTHRPIMVEEILEVLSPLPGETALDCTLGYGGHAQALMERMQPKGKLIALDADPIELPKTEARLRAAGFGPKKFAAYKTNFAGFSKVLQKEGLTGVDLVIADLGVSSMQIDNPERGFSVKQDGPLDMRMNPERGQPASTLLQQLTAAELARLLEENSDEPHAGLLAEKLAGKVFKTTSELAKEVRRILKNRSDVDLSVRRVFQSLRIAVNDEFSALDMLLRHLPFCLNPGGRVAILSFHSGEDRRVKKSFAAGFREGLYEAVARDVIRPSLEEQQDNPRSSPAKLRWAKKSAS